MTSSPYVTVDFGRFYPHLLNVDAARVTAVADVSLDLETLGVTPGSVVLDVGMAVVSPQGLVVSHVVRLDVGAQIAAGATVDAGTLEWWMHPDRNDARRAAFSGRHCPPLGKGLDEILQFLQDNSVGRNRRMWGNGSSFDCGLLAATYRRAGRLAPWDHWTERDLRTLRDVAPAAAVRPRDRVPHVAEDDAVVQLFELHSMIAHLRRSSPL